MISFFLSTVGIHKARMLSISLFLNTVFFFFFFCLGANCVQGIPKDWDVLMFSSCHYCHLHSVIDSFNVRMKCQFFVYP